VGGFKSDSVVYIFDTITNAMHNIAILLFTLSKIVTHGSEYHLKCRIYVVRTKIYVNKFAIFYRLISTVNYQM